MINLLEFELDELKQHFQNRNIKPFRAHQIFDWIYKKQVFDYSRMLNLSKDLRQVLRNEYMIGLPELSKKQVSSVDGTKKYLWQLNDGEHIESVLLIQYVHHHLTDKGIFWCHQLTKPENTFGS